MNILAIDYGERKMGFAIGNTDSRMVEPYGVIRFKSWQEANRKIVDIVELECVDKIVIGISEGPIAKKIKSFADNLKGGLKIPVVFQDETLTSQEARSLAIEASIRRKKRRKLEDAYSAALILQSYFEFHFGNLKVDTSSKRAN